MLDPEIPQALRLQAILTTGIVKIHEKKVSYLHEDAHGALQRLHRVADGADGGDGDGDGDGDGGEGKVGGGRKRKKDSSSRITRGRRGASEEEREVPDLGGGFGDFGFGDGGTQLGLQSLEDDDYFVVDFQEYGDEMSGYGDGYDYMMDSPPEFLQEIQDRILPRLSGGGGESSGGDGFGYEDYSGGYEDYGGGYEDEDEDGRAECRRRGRHVQIVVRERKRKRAAQVDSEGIVDPGMLSMNASSQSQERGREGRGRQRGDIEAWSSEAGRGGGGGGSRLVSLASFPTMRVGGSAAVRASIEAAAMAQGRALEGILNALMVNRTTKARREARKGVRRGARRRGVEDEGEGVGGAGGAGGDRDDGYEIYGDPNNGNNGVNNDDKGMVWYDGAEMEGGVELEQLRTALHLTPQNTNHFGGFGRRFRVGPGGTSSASMPGSVRSSVDLSREDSGLLTNSVQKDKLSDLLLESQYELEGGRRSGRRGDRGDPSWNHIDHFRLQETNPSEPQDPFDALAYDAGSHTLDILTKARLCCRSWGGGGLGDFGDGHFDGLDPDIMSLEDITNHLSRQEAAKMFHHVLVGVTTGIINATQSAAYAPVLIHFKQ